MWYPSVDDLVETNKRVLREVRVKKADQHKLLSRGVLENVLQRTGEEKGDVYEKAVTLLIGMLRTHPFASANRRTAYLATKGFLERNGEKTRVAHDPEILQGIRQEFYTRDEIRTWLQGNEIKRFRRS